MNVTGKRTTEGRMFDVCRHHMPPLGYSEWLPWQEGQSTSVALRSMQQGCSPGS